MKGFGLIKAVRRPGSGFKMTNYRAQDLTAGDRIGHFRVLAQLGRGGMGSVYLAEDETLERQVAIKVILPELADDEGFRKRFEREAKSAASIDHPNVVPVYAAGVLDGRLYLAMRYIEGADLERSLAKTSAGKLDVETTLRVLAAVASALDTAHKQGLVHRDVKPANILLEGEAGGGSIFLTDFGLTRPWGGKGETQTDSWLGTPDYAAPEQVKSGWVDARTDVYSLGCVLYRMLSGSVPHRVSGPRKVLSIVEDPVPRIPDIDPALDAVIQRATAKRADDRFPSAGDLAAAALEAASCETKRIAEHSVAVGAAATGLYETDPGEMQTQLLGRSAVGQATAQLPAQENRSGVKRFALVAMAVASILVGVGAAIFISGGGGEETRTVVKTLASTVTEEAVPRVDDDKQSEASGYQLADESQTLPGLSTFEGTDYGLLVPDGWIHDEIEVLSEAGFRTNIWREPSDPEGTYIRVDGGNSESASDPVAASEDLVEQLRESSDYTEHFYGPEVLDGREAARWVFGIDGDKRVDYFFLECGRGLAVVGSTFPARFPEFAPMFRAVAASARIDCSG
jgi:hypothetical protein